MLLVASTTILPVTGSTSTRATLHPAALTALMAAVTSRWRKLQRRLPISANPSAAFAAGPDQGIDHTFDASPRYFAAAVSRLDNKLAFSILRHRSTLNHKRLFGTSHDQISNLAEIQLIDRW
jgi:hypothetical protein